MTESLASYVRRFLEYCELEKGHSHYTLRNYDHYLGRFLQFCDKKQIQTTQQITLELVRTYRLWLAHGDYAEIEPAGDSADNVTGEKPQNSKKKPMHVKTMNYHLIALRSFLKYLAKQDITSLAPEKIELADEPGRQIEFLEVDEIERLLNAPLAQNRPSEIPVEPKFASAKRDRQNLKMRDKALLEVLFSTGLRVSELAELQRNQVNLETGEFAVRGKGGKVRVVFLSDTAKEWLGQYLAKRQDEESRVFPITVRQIQRLVDKYARLAGIVKHVHPHVLRHSMATDMIQSGADLRSVQELLGHSSITTTQIYTHVTNPQLKEIHKAFHARRRGKNFSTRQK